MDGCGFFYKLHRYSIELLWLSSDVRMSISITKCLKSNKSRVAGSLLKKKQHRLINNFLLLSVWNTANSNVYSTCSFNLKKKLLCFRTLSLSSRPSLLKPGLLMPQSETTPFSLSEGVRRSLTSEDSWSFKL